MPFTEDLTVFLQTGDFATAALYKAGGSGSGVTVNVIFDQPGLTDSIIVTGTNPTAIGRASDFASFTNRDTLTINGVVYRITLSTPIDDGALTTLNLEKRP